MNDSPRPPAKTPYLRYCRFRRMMTELGISREDVEFWTKETVRSIVRQRQEQINVSHCILEGARDVLKVSSPQFQEVFDNFLAKLNLEVEE